MDQGFTRIAACNGPLEAGETMKLPPVHSRGIWGVGLALACLVQPAFAQDDSKVLWEEYEKSIKNRESIAVLGPTLFGDSVNLSNGALSFSITDVSIPGNNALPVEVTRRYNVKRWKGLDHDEAFADWSLALPNISGTYSTTQGWISRSSSAPLDRCSITSAGIARPPDIDMGGGIFFQSDTYWKGLSLDIPGRGGGELLLANTNAQAPTAGGPYYWVTNDFTYIGCLDSTDNSSGEGFYAITSDGVRYEFTHMAAFVEPRLKDTASFYSTGTHTKYLSRKRYVLYATHIEDRFGNWVEYSYSNAAGSPVMLTAINSSDGRSISITYNEHGSIDTVIAAGRTWTYGYDYPAAARGTLTSVVLPDGSVWAVDFAALSDADIDFQTGDPEEILRNCAMTGTFQDTTPTTGTITHPSGAVGAFTVAPKKFRRSNVPEICEGITGPVNNPNDDTAYYPVVYDVLALTNKKVTGVGLPPMEWIYDYSRQGSFGFIDQNDPCATNGCPGGTSITSVTGPDDFIRYTFGASFRYDEGKLLRVEKGSSASSILEVTDTSYFLGMTRKVGSSVNWRGDAYVSEYLLPQRSQVIQRDGVSFATTVNTVDPVFARPTNVTRSSSAGNSRTDVTTYHDNLSLWVLGQTATVTNADTGKIVSETQFHPNALPHKSYRHGVLEHELTYAADGTLGTVKDGNGNVTTLGSWKRGVPRLIQYPATPEALSGATESAVVNDMGWIESRTDESGSTWSYAYDDLGRLTQISYPGGGNPTIFAFEKIGVVEHGIAGGHWRHLVSTGNARKYSYLDAFWRPMLTWEHDTANIGGTQRFQRFTYDASGRTTFSSYPSDTSATLAGVWTEYDALGRTTSATQDSELGLLPTTTQYLSGNITRVTDPAGNVTDTHLEAYGSPDASAPVLIEAPEGVSTAIPRDIFGKPVELIRYERNE